MPIITRIRTFLHMDKLTVNLDPDFVDSVGLYIDELRKPEPHGMEGCLVHIGHSNEFHQNNFNAGHAVHHATFHS